MTKIDISSLLSGVKEETKHLGLRKIRLFGSCATSTATIMSNINIVVYLNKFGICLFKEKLQQLRHKLQKLFKQFVDFYDLNHSISLPLKEILNKK